MKKEVKVVCFSAVLILALIFLTNFSSAVLSVDLDSDGYFEVHNCSELQEMSENLSGNYELDNDVDCSDTINWNSGAGFAPVGSLASKFTGDFKGNNYNITNLYISRSSTDYIGLFGYADSYVDISNVSLFNVSISGKNYVGALIGFSNLYSTIINSSSTGTVSGTTYTGGLIGYSSRNTITNCSSSGTVSGTSHYTGGLIGYNYRYGTITDSYSTSNVSGVAYTGGLIGWKDRYGTITNSHSTGTVSGTTSVGGLIGYNNYNTITNSYSTGNASGSGPSVGGLAGYHAASYAITNSYSTGNVSGTTSVGGLVGSITSYADIINSYYNYDSVLINGNNVIMMGALYETEYNTWISNDKSLDVDDYLSKSGDDYIINNVSDFKKLLAFGQNATLSFKLNSNLNLSSENDFYIPYLGADFDGNDYNISGLNINLPTFSYLGLFGYISSTVQLSNVSLLDVNVSGYLYTAGLAGYSNYGTITNSYSTGIISGHTNVAGLVGYNNQGTITNSYSTGTVSGSSSQIGGLVGYTYLGTITNSYSTGTISGGSTVGGFAGYSRTPITNCSSTGTVSGTSSVGGFTGQNYYGTITNSYSTGTVSGTSYYIGGLAGYSYYGSITNSYSTGNASGTSQVAGFTGYNYNTPITNSYSTGTVSGTSNSVGGFIGQGRGSSTIIINSYSTGNVSSTSSSVGGFIGYSYQTVTINNSYSTGTVSGTTDVGGFAGYQDATSKINNGYWYNSTENPGVCVGNDLGTTTCSAADSESYFYDYTGEPILNWDFDDIWSNAYSGIAHVLLQWMLPSINFVTGTTPTGNYAIDYITANVTASDSSGIDTVIIYLYNSTGLYDSVSNSTSFLYNFTSLPDDTYYLNATVNNTEAYMAVTETRTITLDSTPPSINITGPLNQSYSTNVSGLNYTYIETNPDKCWYSLDGGLTNSSTQTCGTNWTGLTSIEGSNNWTVYMNDTVGNENSTIVYFSKDTTYPLIDYTTGTESNDSYKSQNWIYINVSVTESDEDTITFNLYNDSGQVNSTSYIDSTRTINWTGLAEGTYYYNVTVNDTLGNENSTETRWISLDTIYPLIAFEDPTPENNSIRKDQFTINVSITDTNFANVTYNWNGSETVYNPTDNASYFTDLGSGNWLFNLTQTGLIAGESYTYSVEAFDSVGNSNSTETKTITGNSAPTLISTTHTPTSVADLDPDVLINITVNVSDIDDNFDSAILQYKNSTSDWTNVTMNNLTVKGLYTLLNANFTPDSEGNWTYRIWANDTQADSVTGSNTTLSVSWDCTWTATSDLGATSGWDENKEIGNIIINNTGDSEFADSSCSLSFHIVHNLDVGRIYFDDWASNKWYNYYDPSPISAKSNRTIKINASFLLLIKQDEAIITITESAGRSNTSERNTTATIVSNQEGPYLYQSITSNPSSVDLTPGNFSLQAYLRNLMGSAVVNPNNTAYNVTFYWTLPSGLTNVSGNLTTDFTNITDSDLHNNNIDVSFSDLASMTQGVKTIYLHAQGYNLSGSLIADANNNTLLNESVDITFLCYNTSDGILVTACGSLDGDYEAPTTTTTPTTPVTSSSGGGGGSSSIRTETASSSEDLQLVRGKQNEIIVLFKNKDLNQSIRNILLEVSGKISKYIKIGPKEISSLEPGKEINLTLTIISPTYIDIGTQEIVITITGKKGANNYRETKKLILEIHELSGEEAKQLLKDSQNLIKKLDEANLTSNYLTDLLNQSRKEIKTFNYEFVRDNHKIIEDQVIAALKTKEIIEELTQLILAAEQKGIGVQDSSRLLKLAILSMERREFEQSYERAKDAQMAYALEVKGEIGKISYYFKNYPKQISLAIFFIMLLGLGTHKTNKIRMIKKKIKQLKNEELMLSQLMGLVQKETFKEKKMSMDEYETAMEQYQKKLSRTIEQLIELESERAHALKFSSKNKRLLDERDEIIKLVKQLQNDYLKEGKMETKSYELRLESYNRRLTEVEESLALLEAKQAFKGGLKFWRLLKVPKEERL